MRVKEFFRRWKLQQLIDARDDLDNYVYKWGFGMSPSEIRKARERIEKLNKRIERLERSDDC